MTPRTRHPLCLRRTCAAVRNKKGWSVFCLDSGGLAENRQATVVLKQNDAILEDLRSRHQKQNILGNAIIPIPWKIADPSAPPTGSFLKTAASEADWTTTGLLYIHVFICRIPIRTCGFQCPRTSSAASIAFKAGPRIWGIDGVDEDRLLAGKVVPGIWMPPCISDRGTEYASHFCPHAG